MRLAADANLNRMVCASWIRDSPQEDFSDIRRTTSRHYHEPDMELGAQKCIFKPLRARSEAVEPASSSCQSREAILTLTNRRVVVFFQRHI
jgi:hypothetical protein